MKLKTPTMLAVLGLAATLASAQQGVTKDEIRIGTIQDPVSYTHLTLPTKA